MIILDEEDQQKLKDPPVTGPTLRYPERAAGRRPFSPLPDYETSQALAFNIGSNDSLISSHKPPPKLRIIDSKFWRAALSALAAYVLLSIVIGIPIIVSRAHQAQEDQQYAAYNYAVPWPSKSSSSDYSSAMNDIVDAWASGVDPKCNDWTSVTYPGGDNVIASMSRSVPPNGQFGVTSNYTYYGGPIIANGDLNIDINPNSSVTDAVFSVTMHASSDYLFNRTLVCFALSTNLSDLSLYVPDNLTASDSLLFNMTLLFPQAKRGSDIDALATYLPGIWQTFGDLKDYVNIKKVTIEGAGSKIDVTSLQADRILVDTSLQPISGEFHATESVMMSTIQAPIHASIFLYNSPESNYPTFLDLTTGNGNLTANVTVLAPNKFSSPRLNFIANARTFNGGLSLNMVHDPSSPPAAIKLQVANGYADANVKMDEKFEGVFQASTKLANANVHQGSAYSFDYWNPDLERTFNIDYQTSTRFLGWIGWGERPLINQEPGQVVVETSFGNAVLSFDG
ncbi:hypothetical protein BJ138DRAFT_1123987 [Hygrophoropsis aurantiaca]|uniref:Uncharacterized protein n=1 Tax=Hygrophoropsis aurantiaca TaxID=72124 RepID=A0ACB8AMX6_9AGAM|nr:hypothetical protein BJ138DRAFT_1123987 [Hygrophoropsis aurantiaca]